MFLSKEHKLHTTRSWEFLGLRGNDINSAWQKGRFGENTIIANIDTGTNFTHNFLPHYMIYSPIKIVYLFLRGTCLFGYNYNFHE